MEPQRNPKTARWKIVFGCSLAVFLAGLGFLIYLLCDGYFSSRKYEQFLSSAAPTSSEAPLPDNPIDFASLQAVNTDVYAWIRIPNTNIDYPVLQSVTEDDGFYLDHDINKQYKFAGSIYSERKNSTDFSDPNTVLYGHNMKNGSMFQNLHKFRDKTFFDENQYIYIYTPGHILTYEIFAAYRYDDRHILNSFNFSDPAVFAEYLEYVKAPKSMIVNTRPVELNTDSRLLTLSTCIGNQKNYRYLVQGVLKQDEPTK